MGCHFLLQGIFLTQGSNPGLPHCGQILYQLSHKGSPLGSQKVKVKSISCVRLFATPWTVAYQAPLSMGFSRQEYWSGLPCPSPWDLPNPRIELRSPTLRADSLPVEPPGRPKNTGAGSLSLLQGLFPTQESNWGLLHCRQIHYRLRYQKRQPRGQTHVSTLQEDSLPAEPPGRPKNTGVGSLSLHEGIFPTQESQP